MGMFTDHCGRLWYASDNMDNSNSCRNRSACSNATYRHYCGTTWEKKLRSFIPKLRTNCSALIHQVNYAAYQLFPLTVFLVLAWFFTASQSSKTRTQAATSAAHNRKRNHPHRYSQRKKEHQAWCVSAYSYAVFTQNIVDCDQEISTF